MSRVPSKKPKQTKLTREEILKGIDWKPGYFPASMPQAVREQLDREQQDYLVGWVQGLAAHIDKYDQAQQAARESAHPLQYPGASVQVEIDPTSDVGTMMAELRGAIDRADLAGKGIEAQQDITVRSGIVGNDLDGLRLYLRSLDPFKITFGTVSIFPASVNSHNAAVLKVDVIGPVLKEINLAMEQHATCKPADFDYQPHAIVAYLKPKAIRKYVGNKLLEGRTMEVSTLSIRPKDGETEFVQLIDAPAPWKEEAYNWPGDDVKSPQRKRARSSPSCPDDGKRPRLTNLKKRHQGDQPASGRTTHIDFFVRYPHGGSYMEQLMPALDRLNQPWVGDPQAEGGDAYCIFLADSKQTLRKAVRLIERAHENRDGDNFDPVDEAEYQIHCVLGVSSIAHDVKHWQWEHDVPILAGLGIELRVAELPRAVFRVRLKRINSGVNTSSTRSSAKATRR